MEYLIPDGVSSEAIECRIRGRFSCRSGPSSETEACYYDTFDWSVHRSGGLLGNQDGALRWTSLTGAGLCVQPLEGEPGLVRDLETGPVRARLPASAEIRRLLPLVRIHSRGRQLQVLEGGDETIARLWITTHEFDDPFSGVAGALPARLRVEGVTGRGEDLDVLLGLIEGELELAPAVMPPPLEALAALGRGPGDYVTKPDVRLDPAERADLAVRRILLALLDVLEANVAGARAGWDTEFLHDLRVATRRTRSVLGQLKGVFPEAMVERFAADFVWAQQVTGPVRDRDVYLLAFDDYQRRLPPILRPELEPLRAYLLARYDADQAELAAVLGSPRFEGLLRDWRAFLEMPVPSYPDVPNAASPIKGLADARIRRMAKRVLREGRAIRPDSPPEELHELRKSCKKLRYLLELCASLYPEAAIKSLIKPLKLLLDRLGAFQDLSVQARHLDEMAEQMYTQGCATPRTLLAMGALIGHLLERQGGAREGFEEAFAAFDDPRAWARQKSLLWCAKPVK